MSKQIQSFFDQKAENWDSIRQIDPEKIQAILKITGLASGQKVLDAACGTGILFPAILAHSPGDFHAIDLSENMIAKAKEKEISQGINLKATDIMSYEERDFDYLILFNAYPHFLDPQALAKKLNDLIKTGGRFVIAHAKGRQPINDRHKDQTDKQLARLMASAQEEGTNFSPYFNLDILIDSPDFYIISGLKK